MSLRSIESAIESVCKKITSLSETDGQAETVGKLTISVRELSQAYNIVMDAEIARQSMQLHVENCAKLPGEIAFSN